MNHSYMAVSLTEDQVTDIIIDWYIDFNGISTYIGYEIILWITFIIVYKYNQ